jgi:hypothetical protein
MQRSSEQVLVGAPPAAYVAYVDAYGQLPDQATIIQSLEDIGLASEAALQGIDICT